VWVIYPFWLAMFVKGEFVLWSAGLVAVLFFLAYAFVNWFDKDVVAQGITVIIAAAAVVFYIFRWSREFLTRMSVDFDAANGDGRIIIQRFVPSPTEPEYVEFPLQQAVEGAPEINTRGLVNTLISQLKVFKGLRVLTIGDLTLRGPAAPRGLTMYNLRDPGAVRKKMEVAWKKISAAKAKDKAKRDREEDIARMRIAVTDGIVAAFKKPEMRSVVAPAASTARPQTVAPRALAAEGDVISETQAPDDSVDNISVGDITNSPATIVAIGNDIQIVDMGDGELYAQTNNAPDEPEA
jgi:hypothetical protein